MKVTIKDYLNVRVGQPSLNAPTFQYLAPGSIIEVEDKIYKGDSYEGINSWIKDLAGNYYWKGGVLSSDVKYPWWIQDFGINDAWGITKGENVNVIILDSGIADTSDLANLLIERRSVINDDGVDRYGHGSLIASIIGGNGSTIQGVAPNVKIISMKITRDKVITVQNALDGLADALKVIKNSDLYVINCSFAFHGISKTDQDNLNAAIGKITSLPNTILCAAVGNGYLRNSPYPVLPASCSKVISVEGFMKSGEIYSRLTDSNFWSGINICAPGDYPTVELNKKFGNYILGQGSSMACAYASGLAALYLSKLSAKGTLPQNGIDFFSKIGKATILDTLPVRLINKNNLLTTLST